MSSTSRGHTLKPEARKQIVRRMQELAQIAARTHAEVWQQYQGITERIPGADLSQVLPEHPGQFVPSEYDLRSEEQQEEDIRTKPFVLPW